MTSSTYVNSMYIKQQPKFDTLNISIKVSEFIDFINNNTNEKGYCNLIIAKRKEPTEFGVTHYCKLNTWESDQTKQSECSESSDSKNSKPTTTTMTTMTNDTQPDCGDLPF